MQEKNATIQAEDRLLKAIDVAKILNISRSLAYRLLQKGVIPVVRINQVVRVHPKDLELFIAENSSCESLLSIVE